MVSGAMVMSAAESSASVQTEAAAEEATAMASRGLRPGSAIINSKEFVTSFIYVVLL